MNPIDVNIVESCNGLGCLTIKDWLPVIGTLAGSLVGTGLAGWYTLRVSKEGWEKQYFLSIDSLRTELYKAKNSFYKVYEWSNAISIGNLTTDEEVRFVRDLENHVQLILDKFDQNKVPADLYKDFKFINTMANHIRNTVRIKNLEFEGNSLYNQEELKKYTASFKKQYEKIYKELKIE